MFVSHDDLVWMLRQIYGQRIKREKLIFKFKNHGLPSLLPYFDRLDTMFNQHDDKLGVKKNALAVLEARINRKIDEFDCSNQGTAFLDLENHLLPLLIRSLNAENSSALEKGARVRVRPETDSIHVRPGSEGFITEKLDGAAKVRFYSLTGRYGVDLLSREIGDDELQILTRNDLLVRHGDLPSAAHYFFRDSLLRSMKASIDSSVYSCAADLAVQFLTDKGFMKIDGDECVGVMDRIFPVLAPRLDQAYRNPKLFSSPTLSSPPSERKAHVLRLELTTGCAYNRCTFCSEYSDMPAVTKTSAAFKGHVDAVFAAIGAERSRIQRLFIGGGDALGVDTDLLVKSLNYASNIFNPERISVYGRTASILEKSVDELKKLKDEGLSLIYWGLESGSDEVLNYICKDCTCDDMIEASQKLAEAQIEVSAMLMPGAGGLKFAEQHVVGTLNLLHRIEIKYLTLLAINPAEHSLYAKNMRSESDNRDLTPDEVNVQVYRLLEGLTPTGVQIGMFTEEIDQASSNTKRLNCQFTAANKDSLLREFWNAPIS